MSGEGPNIVLGSIKAAKVGEGGRSRVPHGEGVTSDAMRHNTNCHGAGTNADGTKTCMRPRRYEECTQGRAWGTSCFHRTRSVGKVVGAVRRGVAAICQIMCNGMTWEAPSDWCVNCCRAAIDVYPATSVRRGYFTRGFQIFCQTAEQVLQSHKQEFVTTILK